MHWFMFLANYDIYIYMVWVEITYKKVIDDGDTTLGACEQLISPTLPSHGAVIVALSHQTFYNRYHILSVELGSKVL